MQQRVTLKTTTIIFSAGVKVLSFRSLSEVPEHLRERLIQSTSGPYSSTLLIADEAGRQEVLRSLKGEPSPVESRQTRPIIEPGEPLAPGRHFMEADHWRRVAEIALLAGIGACLWLLAAWR